MRPKVDVTREGFKAKRGFHTASMKWEDVVEIVGVRFPKITYDEDFLILSSADVAVAIGQLDKNFDAFERSLIAAFPDFPRNWRTDLQFADLEDRVQLWKRSPGHAIAEP